MWSYCTDLCAAHDKRLGCERTVDRALTSDGRDANEDDSSRGVSREAPKDSCATRILQVDQFVTLVGTARCQATSVIGTKRRRKDGATHASFGK